VKKFDGKQATGFVLDEQMIDGIAAAHGADGLATHHASANGVNAVRLDVFHPGKMDAVFVTKRQVAEEILKRVDAALREEFGALRANAFDHAYFGAEVHRHWICTPAKRAIGKCNRKAGTHSSYIIPAANKQKHARKTAAKLAPLARVPIE